jgi:plastocyanin
MTPALSRFAPFRLLASLSGCPSVGGGRVTTANMVRDDQGRTYFRPRDIAVKRGDTLRFIEQTGRHNVDFLPDSNPAGVTLPPVTQCSREKEKRSMCR